MIYNVAGFTLAGVYHYFNLAKEAGDVNKTLFEDITLFEGGTYFEQDIPAIDKDILVADLLEHCGELCCYRQQPFVFRDNVLRFFKEHEKQFARMWIALNLDYNPIYNYDRYEDWSDTLDGEVNHTGEDTKTIKPDGSETLDTEQKGTEKTQTTPHGSESVTNENITAGTQTTTVAGENSSTWYNSEKVETEVPKTKTTTEYGNGTRYDESELSFGSGNNSRHTITTTSFQNRETEDKDVYNSKVETDNTNTHKGHLYGNIGVTTSASMVREILEVYDFNMYNYICDLFQKELLYLIY